jgi:hypothetical protein
MIANNHSSRSRLANSLRAAAPPAAIAFAVAILLRFPPTQNSFYPQCPIRELFDLQCPGCGATRAIAAILHGHFTEAMNLNALITLLLPFAAAYGLVCYIRFVQRKAIRWPQPTPAVVYAAFAVTAVFTVIRNLSPHLL